MKILHVANFNMGKYGNTYYNTDRKLTNGLIRNGHFVYEFSYRDVARYESFFRTTKLNGERKANRFLLKTVSQFQPDLLLLGHSELITVETLERIREMVPGIKIALWYVDPLFHEQAIQHVINRLECFDAVFATTGGEWLAKFKGSRNVAAFFPNPVDPSVECHQSFNLAHAAVDLLFCGREAKGSEREYMLKELKGKLSGIYFEIWGSLNRPKIFGHAYYQKLAETKMGLNLSRRTDIPLYSSDRIAQLTGNGILTFTGKIPCFETLFTKEEVVYFENMDELADQINYFHRNDSHRRQIAAKGWQKAHASFNVERIARYMLEVIFNKPFSEPYEWRYERIL